MRMFVVDNWSEECNSSENQISYSEHLFEHIVWDFFLGIVLSFKFPLKSGKESNTMVTAMNLESSQARL